MGNTPCTECERAKNMKRSWAPYCHPPIVYSKENLNDVLWEHGEICIRLRDSETILRREWKILETFGEISWTGSPNTTLNRTPFWRFHLILCPYCLIITSTMSQKLSEYKLVPIILAYLTQHSIHHCPTRSPLAFALDSHKYFAWGKQTCE